MTTTRKTRTVSAINSTTEPVNFPAPRGGGPEVALTFKGNRVTGVWYDPKLQGVLCALCGKGCVDKSRCYNANPYCG